MRKQAELPMDAPQSGYRPLADRMRPPDAGGIHGPVAPARAGTAASPAADGRRRALDGALGPAGQRQDDARAARRAQPARRSSSRCRPSLAGVKDIRAAVERRKDAPGRRRATVLFLDEVHRFNKAQQDTFLPFVEDGTLLFIGATTENPSFELNSRAAVARARVRAEGAHDGGASATLHRARARATPSGDSARAGSRPRPERSSFSPTRPTATRGAR